MYYLPYSGTYVVVKVILDKSANNAGFPDSGVLKPHDEKETPVSADDATQC